MSNHVVSNRTGSQTLSVPTTSQQSQPSSHLRSIPSHMSSDARADDRRYQKEFRRFEQELFSVVISFEQAKEWADLSNVLARLHRVFTTVPECLRQKPTAGLSMEELKQQSEAFYRKRLTKSNMKKKLGRRLAQCLNPQLPSGVHLNTLKIYESIFNQIGAEGLVGDLGLYSSGLFPNIANVGKQVKAALLLLLEKHYLPYYGYFCFEFELTFKDLID